MPPKLDRADSAALAPAIAGDTDQGPIAAKDTVVGAQMASSPRRRCDARTRGKHYRVRAWDPPTSRRVALKTPALLPHDVFPKLLIACAGDPGGPAK